MRITFYGAARTVTGSQHLIEVNDHRILLDCGLYQGHRAEARERNQHLPFDARAVDVMVLSHAHIDHSGNIPNLVKSGFQGDIICTYATRDLCATMLLDSAYIQERDVEYVNKRRRKRGEDPVEPIYTRKDALDSLRAFTAQSYNRPHHIAPGVTVTLLDAGHMLGSAIVVLDLEDRDSHSDVRLVFSGDLGRSGIPIIRDPETVESADVLILESTYGNRLHPPYPDANKELERIINETYQRGGKVIVPAFAVGRTQQLVYTLNRLARAGDIPTLPIYVDSPLAIDATAIYRLHPEVYDEEILDFMAQGDGRGDPFDFGGLIYTRQVEESKKLNFLREPAIIISASGMAENGRILHHLKNNIEDPKNTVLIIGWQAENTLGRKLVEKEPVVKIFGEPYQNNARCEVINGFSGHADHDELIDWVGAMRDKPRRTFLVHGEVEAATALANDLYDTFHIETDVPEWKQTFKVIL
ncbi:MAG TPA: MBL fold metallo-hydrolase [Spirillospora sp.]|nr:MBL fold metallo-hydrolase [Spirillospora sp.]